MRGMSMLKVGIIGMGTVAPIHKYAVENSKVAKLVAICDNKSTENTEIYTSIEQMLDNEKLDVVHICLPHHQHVEVAKQCAKKGINVFIEKPVAISTEEAKELYDLEQTYGIKVGICLQNRFNDTTVMLKALVDSKRYGKVLGTKGIVTWNRTMQYYNEAPWRGKKAEAGGGAMINQSIHTLDLLSYIVGPFKDAQATVSTFVLKETEIEDTVVANLNYKGLEANAIFFATIAYCGNSSVEVEVVCENGTLTIKGGTLYFTDQTLDWSVITEDKKLPGTKHYYGASHQICIEKFYDAILNGTTDYVTPQEATYCLTTMEAIFLASETKTIVKL